MERKKRRSIPRHSATRCEQTIWTSMNTFPLTTINRCSLGAAFETRYHPSFVTFPKSLVEHFGDRAKALLEIELDSPSVATVQVLVILSSHEVGNGQDTRGWLYSGMFVLFQSRA